MNCLVFLLLASLREDVTPLQNIIKIMHAWACHFVYKIVCLGRLYRQVLYPGIIARTSVTHVRGYIVGWIGATPTHNARGRLVYMYLIRAWPEASDSCRTLSTLMVLYRICVR